MRHTQLLFLPLLALAGLVAGAAGEPLTVADFSPTGSVKPVRQVTARFSAPMIRFGDPRAAAPFTHDCDAPGSSRWVDERTWAHDFEAALPAGMRCTFTAARKLKSLGGAPLAGATSFTFDTGGPAIVASAPSTGERDIDAEQAFLLRLDGALDAASLHAAHCEADGIAEALPVVLMDTARRRVLLDALKVSQPWRWRQLVDPEASYDTEPDTALERLIVAVACGRALPAKAQARLVWGAGIAAPAGPTTRDAQVLEFEVRDDFQVRVDCDRLTARSACVPFGDLRVRFSAPVPASLAAGVRVRATDGRALAPAPGRAGALVELVRFAGPFVARQAYRVELPAALVDDAGREPANRARFPLVVQMDDDPPLAKFAAQFGILERHAAPALPVTLRDVEQRPVGQPPAVAGRVLTLTDDAAIMQWYARLQRSEGPERAILAAGPGVRAIAVPRRESPGATEVVGIPLPQPGLHVVELASPRLGARYTGEKATWHVRASALVTNLAVHFKEGRAGSLVWVTSLDRGAPVRGARVAIRDCRRRELWSGSTAANGLARVPAAALEGRERSCDGWWHGWYVSARIGDDVGFALSDWNQGISPWDFDLRQPWSAEPVVAHSVLDRTLLRAGETLHMKHFLRERTADGFGVPARRVTPDEIVVRHVGSRQEWRSPLSLAGGVGAGDWPIPADARLGGYEVVLADAKRGLEYRAAEFRVEEFRLPTLRAVLQLPAGPLVRPAGVAADVSVTYLAGGGASGTDVELYTRLEPFSVGFPDFEGYRFDGGQVEVGLRRWGEYGEEGMAAPARAEHTPLKLDRSGGARTALAVPGPLVEPRRLVAELAYPDANGERLTTTASATLWPAAVVVGLKSARWPRTGRPFAVDLAVLTVAGTPVAGREVRLEGYSRTVYSYRRRLVGGFYAYDNSTEIKPAGELCRATTDARGRARCTVTVSGSDGMILRAVTEDEAGRAAAASEQVWLAGEDAWWGGGDSDRVDLVPERRRYEPGETARLRAEIPFRDAWTLVTVEREGVLDARVARWSPREPRIDVPVEANYGPNVYVSVLAVRGRVAAPAPTALVDLARPTFRIGYAALEVGRKPYELLVDVRPAREQYRTRERAQVQVTVRRADGEPLPRGAEIAFAAVDSALTELAPNDSWRLLERMLEPRGLEVQTATAQMQVIGRRHYGRKAVPAGGGGGRLPTRELFDTLLSWQARVPLDAGGRATLEVPLNDSLTEFTLVAIGHAGPALFGTGSARIRTSQDLMLLPGLPQIVRQGDELVATAAVRNAGAVARRIEATATVTSTGGAALPPLSPQSLELGPGEAREVAWPLAVPRTATELTWVLAARSPDGAARDELRLRQRVEPWPGAPVAWQATLLRLDAPRSLVVAPPRGAVPGAGGIAVALSPGLAGGLDGVRSYMRDYAYTCLEQRVSRAVALRDRALWDRAMAGAPAHVAANGLLAFFPGLPQGSDVLTSYVLGIAHEAGWPLPEALRAGQLEALGRFARGELAVPGADFGGALLLRRLAAVEALARHDAASPAMLESLAISPASWPTAALADWLSILERLPAIPDREARLAEARRLLRARLTLSATRLSFPAEDERGAWWLLGSADRTAARVLALVAGDPAWREDAPRVALGLIGRQRNGHWDTTLANAWGVLALERYAAAFERTAVNGRSSVTLGSQRRDVDWQATPGGTRVALPWGAAPRLELAHAGSGAPWAVVTAIAAVPLRTPVAAGFRVRRSVTPVEVRRRGHWTRGDLVRVTLEVDADADMGWVVVSDGVPAGSAIVGGGLRRGEAPPPLAAGKGRARAWPTFEERGAASYRAYLEFLPRGRWQLEYVMRLNSAGTFQLPATRVEAMYAPDVFGAAPNAPLTVRAVE